MDSVVIGVIISMVGVISILAFFIIKFIQVINKKNGSSEE